MPNYNKNLCANSTKKGIVSGNEINPVTRVKGFLFSQYFFLCLEFFVLLIVLHHIQYKYCLWHYQFSLRVAEINVIT